MTTPRPANQQRRRPDDEKPHDNTLNEVLSNVPAIMDQVRDPHGTMLVEMADKLGSYLARRKMTTSQIRKLFFEVKNLDFSQRGPYQLNLLRAKLAYAAGRHSQVQDLQRVLDKAIREVGTEETKYRRFVDFFEAIIAYHRRYTGRDS